MGFYIILGLSGTLTVSGNYILFNQTPSLTFHLPERIFMHHLVANLKDNTAPSGLKCTMLGASLTANRYSQLNYLFMVLWSALSSSFIDSMHDCLLYADYAFRGILGEKTIVRIRMHTNSMNKFSEIVLELFLT